MKIRFFLEQPKRETSPISIVVSFSGNQYKKGIGTTIETKYWDQNRQRASVNQRHRDGIKINERIEKWIDAVKSVFDNLEKNRITIESRKHLFELVKCQMDGVPLTAAGSKFKYFTDYFENEFIRRHFLTKSHSRVIRFNVILQKVKEFEKDSGRRYTFEEINLKFYNKFHEYMNRLGHSGNYFGSVVSVIKQVMREAKDIDRLHNNTEFLSSQFKSVSHDVDSVYLNTEELYKIHQAEIGDKFLEQFYPRATDSNKSGIIRSYNIVKNRFLIGAFTGLRMSDFNRIDSSNITSGKITAITKKTAQKVVIPIHPVVKEILDSGFDMSDSLSEAKTRLYIKDICKFVGINEDVEVRESVGGKLVTNIYPKFKLVGTHTARRSFATNAYKAGVPTISIMKITGHTKESTFLRYIRMSSEENAEILAHHPFFGGKKEED